MRRQFFEDLKPFPGSDELIGRKSREIAVRFCEVRNKSHDNRIGKVGKHHGDPARVPPHSKKGLQRGCNDNVGRVTGKLRHVGFCLFGPRGCHKTSSFRFRPSIQPSLRSPSRRVATISRSSKSLSARSQVDNPPHTILCPPRNWPRGRSPAEKGEELAPSHGLPSVRERSTTSFQ